MSLSESKKTSGEAVVSSGLVRSVDPTGDSSGDVRPNISASTKTSGEAVVSSGLVKSVVQTDVSFGDGTSQRSEGVAVAPSTPVKSIGRNRALSGISICGRGKAHVSPGRKGKAIASDKAVEVIAFKDVTPGLHEGELQFRLIHFWEAWNSLTKVLIGVEMLLIDKEGTVIQGFIPFGKIRTYVPHMKAGGTYRLHNFFGSTSKTNYRVADPNVTITFSWNSVLSELVDSSICFLEDRFRIHRFEEFDAACDMKGDLYGKFSSSLYPNYIGHIKLVNGEVPSGSLLLDEAKIAASRRVDIHVQTHDDPVLKLCLWDQAASEFWKKFKASGGTARVILVTTLNPKRYGVLSLSSMTPSRVFLDSDVQETRSYLSWLSSNLEVANRVRADVVVKPEEATLGELLSYMKKTSAKVAWFECTATIDDVVHGSKWYYIGCGECHTKATKGPTTSCVRSVGRVRLLVWHSLFVLLGSAGEELFGKKAAELVDGYYEANDGVGDDDIVPVPQVMLDTIGQTRKFIVKISIHNLEGKTQTLTVTKVLPPEDPAPEGILGEAADEENGVESEDHADDSVKRATDVIESEIAACINVVDDVLYWFRFDFRLCFVSVFSFFDLVVASL
ncbi:hypothetical protein Bca101_022826 [Brassica carinata]